MTIEYRMLDVPVAGGSLAAGRWTSGDHADRNENSAGGAGAGRAAGVVVASHGITANHLSWQRVAESVVAAGAEAPSVVAVDHRGRGGSADTPGPFGLAAHADDLIAVLDHLGLESAPLLGHSMGGFVAALAAERHPDRVERLILVDGGLPFPLDLPPDADVESVVQSVIGPALDRLDQRWPDEQAYVDFFAAHPAFRPPNRFWPTVEAYVRHDAVVTAEGEVRSSVDKQAVLVDGGAAIVDPDSSSALERIATPTTLLWAPRGILDQAPGLYQAAQIDDAVARLGHLRAVLVADTNHYTIAVGDPGAAAIAAAVLAPAGPATD